MEEVILLILLTLLALQDLRCRKMDLGLLLAFICAGLLCGLLRGGGISLLSDLAPGLLLLGLARVSGGAVGRGDGLVLLGAGLFNGWRGAAGMLVGGLMLCSVWTSSKLIKGKGKETVPLVPFLLLGEVLRWRLLS